MFRFVVLDLPQLGAIAMAAVVVALLYLLYRDMRSLIHMVMDLREEMMIGRMSGREESGESRQSCVAGGEKRDQDEKDREVEDITSPLVEAGSDGGAGEKCALQEGNTADDVSVDASGPVESSETGRKVGA